MSPQIALDSDDRAALDAALRDLVPVSGYARGVRDVLHLLGLLGTDGAPAGRVPAMLIDSLRAHLADGVTVGFAWDDLDAEAPRGVDILRAFEAARVAAVASPTPSRSVRVAQAVIKARRSDEDLYLMQYDAHAGRYQPIGGKQDAPDADSAAALRREMMEELGLDAVPGPDACTLALLRAGHFRTALSPTYGILTRYTIDYYAVSAIRFAIRTGADTRWITRAELAALRAADGRPITPVYQEGLGLAALDALPPALDL
jgi:8-oxo-dGTP pyrophosphatase MutT (NUDIX family)